MRDRINGPDLTTNSKLTSFGNFPSDNDSDQRNGHGKDEALIVVRVLAYDIDPAWRDTAIGWLAIVGGRKGF